MHRGRDKTMLLNVLCIVCCCYFTILSEEAFDPSFIGVLVSGTNYREIVPSTLDVARKTKRQFDIGF